MMNIDEQKNKKHSLTFILLWMITQVLHGRRQFVIVSLLVGSTVNERNPYYVIKIKINYIEVFL